MRESINFLSKNWVEPCCRIKTFVLSAMFLFVFLYQTNAQQSYIGNSFTNPSVAPGAPAGSYAISDIENVNLFNGNLNISLPLLRIGGRGSAGYTMMLPIEYKWNISHLYYPDGAGNWNHHYFPNDNWLGNNPDFIQYSPGVMRMQRAADVYGNCQTVPATAVFGKVLSRIVFIGADGTHLEFYDDRTKGKPAYFENCLHVPDAANRGTVWVALGGSGVTFVSDSVANEWLAPANDNVSYPSGVMMYPDGTRYRIDQGKVTSITDRNGNKVSFNYGGATGGSPDNLASITDPIGRVVTFSYGQGNTDPDIITFNGTNGATRTIEIGRNLLGNLLRSGQTMKSTLELFPGLAPDVNSNDFRNPRRVAYVKLPDGRQYNFKYNSYSDVARIELPTGGAYEYEWDGRIPVPYIQRWVTERREYPDGGSGSGYESKIKYEYFDDDPYINGKPNGKTKMTRLAGTVNGDVSLGVSKHYFIGAITFSPPPFSFDDSGFGKEFQTELYNADGTSLIKKVFNEYEFRTIYTHTINASGVTQTSYNRVDHRLIRTTTTLADVTPNLVSKSEFVYDPNASFNQQTDVYEFDYGTNAPGNFKRRIHTDFVDDSNYISHTGAHLRSLPLQTWVSSDATGTTKASLTQFEYDNYTNGSNAPLVNRTDAVGHDTTNYGINKINRGNLTKVTTYGSAQNQTEAINVYSNYDILGNVIKTIDAKNYESTIDYSDHFGVADNALNTTADQIRANDISQFLSGKQTYAFVTSVTNPLQWTAYAQIDYFTGAIVNTKDINGAISKTIYNDLLDRPTQKVEAVGTLIERQTSIGYHDALNDRRIEIKSDLNALNDNLLKNERLYDGLGRTIETRRYESDVNYIATLSVPFTIVQDSETSLWRAAAKVSNPYRPNLGEQPIWSTSLNDSLGRNIKIITPDNAIVKTEYIGNTVIVTDQNGRKRRSVTNALGQLIRVDEPNDSGQLEINGSPAQPTNYSYDVLDNLTQVQQIGTTTQQCGGASPNCTQTRTLVYDSLSRLKQVSNPESGLIQYSYDDNGNIIQKTDARNVQTTFTYDELNRMLTRSYSAPANLQNYKATLPVTYTYDNLPNAKGKLITVTSGTSPIYFSETRYLSFDVLGRVTGSQQVTDGTAYNPMSYVYNLSDALIEETYPSGRVVKNVIENNGNLSIVQSKKNSNYGFVKYAHHFTYAASGAVSSVQLGNSTWESTQFNYRFQPTQIALGNVKNAENLLKLNYDYGSTDNNGNVKTQIITVQRSNQTPLVLTQSYVYDSLNRLKSTEEKDAANMTTWKQTYSFDRFGNRRFDQANTTFPISFADQNVSNPAVDISNNRFTTAQGYIYDLVGNLIQDAEGRSFTYDAENKETEVKNSLNQTVGEYWFDGSGKRVKKKGLIKGQLEETIFVYDAFGKLVAEYSTRLSQTPQTQYLTTDNLGTTRINTDSFGRVVSRSDYMPFGEEITELGGRSSTDKYVSDDVRQGFTGYINDEETELDFAEARMYKKELGRFNSADPFGPWAMSEDEKAGFIFEPQQWNRYAYVTNNPLKFTDPLGLEKYTKEVTIEQQKRVHEALVEISKTGTKEQQAIAKFILENDVTITVGAGDSETNVTIDQSTADAMIGAGGPLTDAQAAKLITVKLSSSLFPKEDSEKAQMNLQGELVHEGKHVDDGKNFLQDYSNGKVTWDKIRDLKFEDREKRAYSEEAAYFMHRGGQYINVGISRGVIDKETKKHNAEAIERALLRRYSDEVLESRYSTTRGSSLTKQKRPAILNAMKKKK